MDAAPPPMVLQNVAALTWARAQSNILNSAGGWGRFLVSVLATAWAIALWGNGDSARYSGTGEMIESLGLVFTVCWMTGIAAVPMIALLIGWLPLRMLSAIVSLLTWVYLLIKVGTHHHLLHLSAGTCIVSVIACVRADMALWLNYWRDRR